MTAMASSMCLSSISSGPGSTSKFGFEFALSYWVNMPASLKTVDELAYTSDDEGQVSGDWDS